MNEELEKKAKEIVTHGVYIDRVTYSNMEISLYRLDGDPVEIWFDTVNEIITDIRGLRGAEMNPFLKYIDNTNREN